MYDIKALYEAENVQDAIRLLTEHPQAQESGQEWNLSVFMGWMN